MTKIININNINTFFTVDSYQTFTSDSTDEGMIEYFNDENNTDYGYDDFDWIYDMKKIHKGMAVASIDWIKDSFLDKIILDVTLDTVQSPKYYNYTTDSYNMNVSVNINELREFIFSNIDKYNTWKDKQSYHIDNDDHEAYLIYYIEMKSNNDITHDYLIIMDEINNELHYENTEMKLETKNK
jgi:hypothetical protein